MKITGRHVIEHDPFRDSTKPFRPHKDTLMVQIPIVFRIPHLRGMSIKNGSTKKYLAFGTQAGGKTGIGD
jgi:hypothetical protein